MSTALTLGVSKVAGATTVYWDSDGNPTGDTVTGTSLGGTGNWDASTALWWNGYATTDQAWNNGNFDFATFSGTAGTVTLGTNVNAGGLSFNTTGYTVSGASTLTLGGASTPFITVGSGLTATISASLAGTAGFAANGLGNLVLSGNNSGLSGGITIASGTVTAGSANALGANAITLGSTSGSNAASLLVNTNGLSFSNAITLATNANAGTLTIGTTGTGISTTFSGGVTGTNNFTISEGGGTGSITFSGSSINNTGTVTNAGGGSGTTTISGGIGSNVTGIIESSLTSAINVSTNALTVNSAGTTLTNSAASGTVNILTVSGGVTGTGNLILSNNGAVANGIQLTTTAVNNTGAIINQGTGAGGVLISAPIGAAVTGITQNSSTSALTFSNASNTYSGPINVNAGTFSLTGSLNGGTGGALTVGGGNFSYAPVTGSSTQSVTGVTVNAGGSAINATSTNTLALNALTRNAGGTVAFNSTGSGTISTSATNTNNILGPWATYGSGTSLAYATVTGGNLAAYAYGGAGDSIITTPASITSITGTVNYSLNTATSATAGASASIDTLRSTTGAVTITPNSTGGLTANGIMNAGTGALTIASGSLVIGAGAAPYANELFLATNTQTLTVSAGITGTGTVTIDPTSTGAITLASVNNTGQVINAGQGTSTTTITAVGTNVTGLIETGASPLTVTNAITPTASLNTFVNNGTATFTITGGIAAGSQNITFNANNRGAFSVGNIASTGTITNSGTGTGTTTLGTIPSTVTNITENSAGSALTTGALTVASGGTTLINNNASGSAILTVSGAVGGTGNLVLQNNSAVGANTIGATTGGLTLGAINNTGSLTSSGTGTGTTVITGVIGTGVTGGVIISGTSPVILEGVNTYTSATTINSGATLQLGNQSTNNQILVTGTTITDNGTLIFAPGATSLSYNNVINGSGNITLNGVATGTPANITLGATTSAFTGTYTLNQGRIQITAATNLGSPTSITVNGNGSTLTGGQLFVAGSSAFTVSTPITINGYGPSESAGNLGAIRLNTASDIYSGAITLGSNASIYVPASTTVTVSGVISGGASAQLMIGAPITGTGLGNGLGTLTLTNTNTFSGGTLISGETAALGAVGALGTGSVQLGISSTQTSTGLTESVANALTGTNSLIVNAGTATLSVANNFTGGTVVNNGTLALTGAGAISVGTVNLLGGTMNVSAAGALAGPVVLSLSGGAANFSAAQTYGGGATISGTNVTTVSAASALSGTTNVIGGTLISSITTAAGNNGQIFVSGGLLTSALAGGQFQNVSVSSSGVVNPGGVGTVGTGALTINGLSTTSGGTLQFDAFSPTNADLLNLTGANTIGAGTNFAFGSGNPSIPGTYALIQYTGTTPNLANFVLPTAPTGETYTLNASGGFVNLVVGGTYVPVSAGWLPTAASSFSWNSASNWSGGAIPQYAGDTATFASALAGAQTVTVDGQQHVGTLTFNPTNAFGYTVNAGTAGSVLYLDNGASVASVQNQAQSNTINAPVNLVSNTNFNITSGSNLTLGGTVSGSGKLTVSGGTGSLTLTGTSAWTGGTEVDSGSIVINNSVGGAITSIAGVVTLNGGTLSFTGTSGNQTTLPASFVLNVGASGGTLNIGAGTSSTAGKVNTSSVVGFLTGSGTLTKTGGGVLQDGSPSPAFTGNVILSNNGLIEDQNVAALGFGTSTGFNGGTVTINGPTGTNAPELVVSVGTQLFNPVILNGGTLSTDNGNTAIINNTVTVNAASILRASDFFAPTVSRIFAVNTLAGSSNLAVNAGTTSGVIGMVTLGNASGYTGAITIGANAVLGIGSGSFFGAGATIANFTNATSGIGLVADGDGTSTPEVIAYTLPSQVTAATFGTGNTTGYVVGHQGATVLFNQEANKTISLAAALPYNNTNTLNVQPVNGYGLLLTNQPALTATTTFGVGTVTSIGAVAPTAQASNVIAGLQLTNLTGTGFGITKTGAGTLQLGTSASDASNTFGFAVATPAAINITGGVVSAFADQNLGASGNGITLNNTTSAEFLALGSFGTSRTITIGSATGATLGAAFGSTLTLNSGLIYSAAGNALTKVEDGTLILTTAATGSPTSGTTVSAGTLQISASNEIGSGTITNNSAGAAIQLTGGSTFTQAISLNSVGINSNVGGLTNLSGANTLTGTVTIGGGSLITNQDTNNTFTLGAITNTTTGFNVAGPGNVTVTGVISGAGVVQAMGPGVLRITAAMTDSNSTNIFGGQLTFSGAGQQGTGGIGIGYGGTLTLDDSTSNLNNRNNGHTLGMSTGGGATLNIIGNATASTTETFLGINYGRGENIIQLSPNAAQSITATLTNTSGSFTRSALSSVVYQAPGLGSAAAAGVGVINEGVIANTGFQGALVAGGGANQQIQPWALAYDPNQPTSAITFATASAATGANYRLLAASESTGSLVNFLGYAGSSVGTASTTNANTTVTVSGSTTGLFVGESVSGSGIPAGAYITAIGAGTITLSAAPTATASGVVLNYATTGTNVTLTSAGSLSGNAGTLAAAVNSLTLATGGSLTLGNTQTLTIGGTNGGGILATDTTNGNVISGGIITTGANELDIHTVGNLTINSTITGGAGTTGVGLTKGESGTLTIGANAFYGGQTVINAGKLVLNAGNNTIQFSNYVALGVNATLDLNGNSQVFTDLISDASSAQSGVGIVGEASSVVGTASTSTLVLRGDSTSRPFTGTISGGLSAVFSSTATATKTFTQNQTYTGATLINGMSVTLANNGALSGTSSLTINRASLTLDNTGSTDSSSRLSSSLPITLGGGTLSYIGRAQFLSAETLGNVTTTEGANTINATVQTTGVAGATLTLGGVTRALGSTVNYTNTGGTLGTIGTNPQILLTSNPTLTNNIIDGGTIVNGTDFASYNPTYGVGALGTTGFAGYSPLLLNNAASTDNVSMATSTGIAIGNETINSLRITGTTAINFNASSTLTLGTGGLLLNGNLTMGSAINSGTLTSGTTELFLYANGGTSVINSAITGSNVALVKSGAATGVTINGTNTYTGGTYVDQGTLTLGNAGNATTGYSTLGTGGIFLNGGTLTQTAGSVIPMQAVTLTGSSTLNLSSSLSSSGTTTAGSATITVASTNGIAVGQLVTGAGIPAGEYVTAVNPATNQVTITTGANVAAGTNTINFLVNNSLSSLTFNNDGGVSAPTVSVTGVLNLPNGAITASSTNVGTTNTLTGGNVDLGNVATPTITVNPIQFNGQNIAPYLPTLAIASVLQNASNAISVTGGGNLQLSGASNFTGGVTLANGTNLTIAANSTNMQSGQPLSGPLGTGTFTVGTGSTLFTNGAFTVGNNVVVTGNFTFDAGSFSTSASALSLTLGAGNQTVALPAGAATTITVNTPNMTGGFGDTVTGVGSTIIKNGLGTLLLTNGLGATSTFNGGVIINAGTVLATGVGANGTALGTGPVTLNGGVLALHHNGISNNSVISYGNNVQINTALANAYIDINNNGANTGNIIVMGSLDYGTLAGNVFTSTVSGNPAPGTILNITGGNGYKLEFTGTTLTSATSSPTFNVSTGLTLILPGGFTVGTNLPTNIGGGSLIYSGSNSGATASSPITGTVAVAPLAAQSNTPLGTGGLTLNNGATLQISPLYSNSVNTTGYTAGGTTAKYYFTGQTSIGNAANFGIAPNSTLLGVNPVDSALRQAPVTVNAGSVSTSLAVYQGLLTVTTGGTYYFGAGTDDMYQLVVDGQLLQIQTTGQALNQQGLSAITLAPGTHTITVREFNNGGGGGSFLMYSGPDTASNGITGTPPVNNLQSIPLSALSYSTVYTAANGYQNAAILNNAITVNAGASATIDGTGTDFNYAIPSLTLGAGSTLIAANGTGAVGSIGNGAFIVTGNTNVTAGGGILSPTTGTLVLAGGVTDGGAGLTKTGAGNLVLGASAGTFTGTFNINNGFVQITDPASLTTGTTNIGVAGTTPATLDLNGQAVSTTGNIVLNGGAGPASKSSATGAGLYNSSATTASLPVGGTLSIGAVISAVNASIGGFGDIVINGVVQDSVVGSPWNKVGSDTLTLNGANTFTGAVTIAGGILKLGNNQALGTTAASGVSITSGAALDLNGQTISVAKTLAINGANNSTSGQANVAGGVTTLGAANTLGALFNSSASNASYAGNIVTGTTTTNQFNLLIGGPSLSSGSPGGNITLSGNITSGGGGALDLMKIGADNLILTGGASSIGLFDVQQGTLTVSGAGKLTEASASLVRPGATLLLDNSGTAVSNRAMAAGLFLAGNLTINDNASTAVSEVVSASGANINLGVTAGNGVGQSTITLNAAGGAAVTLQVASTSTSIFNRGAGNTALIRGDGLGTGTTAAAAGTAYLIGNGTSLGLGQTNAQSVGQAGQWNAPNALIYQWAVADSSATGVGTGFAGYSTFGGSANFGTANTGGVASLSINANNAFASAPTLSLINANTVQNNSTITVASTAGLSVGQLVTGTNIPANAVITSIVNATTFTISAVVNNVTGATANNTLTVYANPTTAFSNVTTTASTTVTVSSTANLYVGEVVSGVNASGVATGFIPNGDTIASIVDGTHIVLTTAATAGANPSLIFGLPGYANIATSTAQSFGTANVAQEQNSLTLNAGGGATITTGLQLDSGGVLAVGTNAGSNSYTIGGTGWLTGTSTLNREMIFHVTGTGTTLTVNAPIFSNGSGLTKADGGTLVLGTMETYTGNTTLNSGTTKLGTGVGTNPIFTVYTTAPTPGNAVSAGSGQLFYVNSGATFDLNGNNQAVSNLLSGSGTQTGSAGSQIVGGAQFAGGTVINSSGTATFHIAPNASQLWAGNISNAGAGVLNFVRDGNNTFTVNSPNTLSGTVTLTGGATTLLDAGTFQNASAINVMRSTLIWNDTGVEAVSNRLSSTAPITLTGGGFQFDSRAGTGANPVDAISLGTLNLGIGESSVIETTLNQGSAASITFAGLGTRATGATLNFGNASTALGYNPYIYFTSAPALTNGIIGAWATVNSLASSSGTTNASFATYSPATGVTSLQYQAAGTFGSGVNTLITATTQIPAPIGTPTTTTVNSLTIYNGSTLSFTNAGDTLVIQSGGILSGTDANTKTIGSTSVPGQIVSGAGQDLYIHAGANSTTTGTTITINSKIIDNGSNNNVIIDGISLANSATVILTNANTYGGTTYLSGATLNLNSLVGPAIPGDVILSGGNNAAADSLADSQTQLSFSQSNQLNSTANITMNGASRINMGSGSNSLVSNTQTINNLTINNDAGTNSVDGPTVFTGAGALTINGTVTVSNSDTFTIPTLNGFYNFTTGNIVVNPNTYVPNQVGLAINGDITASQINVSGGGYLGIGGQSGNFTGPVNVNAGGLAFTPTTGTVGVILGGQVVLAANTTFDTRGVSGVIGSLSSSQTSASVINGVQGTAATLTTGLDGTNSTYAGTISSPYPTGLLSLTKIGNGVLTLTGNSTATNDGTLTVSGGGVTVNGTTGALSFTTTSIQPGGTLLVDDSTNVLNNRLGSAILSTTAAILAPTYRTINLQGGSLTVNGNSGTVVSEALGNIAAINGGNITLNSAGTAGINLTIGQLVNQSNAASLLIRGDGLGNAAGAGVATIKFATASGVTAPGLAFPGAQGGGANNNTNKSIRGDILVDNSATGFGAGFLTIDSATGLVRPLGYGTGITFSSELASTLTTATSSTTNVALNSVAFGYTTNAPVAGAEAASLVANSLTLQSGGGVNLGIIAGNVWGANGGLLTMNLQQTGAILALGNSGNTSITAGQYQSSSSITLDFHVLPTATLTLNTIINSGNGWVKADGGTLVLNGDYFTNGGSANTVTINGGTLQLGASVGANALFVQPTATTPSATALAVNTGTFDLNGNSQLVGTVTSTNPLPYAGGAGGVPNAIITNSSATTATFSTNAANSVSGIAFTGNLNLDKSGNTTMSLSSPQSYTGTTTVRGGNITLRDQGSIASTANINLNFAELILDNSGFVENVSRISSSAPVNFTGGTLRINTSERVDSENFGTFNLNSGSNLLYINQYSNNGNSSSPTLTIANLTETTGATLIVNAPFSTALGNFTAANAHVYLTQLNGAPFNAASMVNGIIAPWMVVANTAGAASGSVIEWATYSNVAGITSPGQNGTAGYSSNALTAAGVTDNVSATATVVGATNRTINSLAVRNPAAATAIGMNSPTDQLIIGSGGILTNDAQSKGISIGAGSLTAGIINQPSTLYLNSFNGTTTINSPIVNNGTGVLSLVRSGNATVNLTPALSESFTFAASAASTTTLTVPNASFLSVGMGITGSLIPANTIITAIAGNVITISNGTTANGTTATPTQFLFSPATSTATGATTAGTNTVTIASASLPGTFVPTVGMTIGSSVNLPAGATITNVSLNAGTYTLTLSSNAITSSSTAALVFNALSNSYTGTTTINATNDQFSGGTTNLSGNAGAIVIPGNLVINGGATVTVVNNQGQIASTSNVTINGSGTLNLVGTNTLSSVTFNNPGGNATPTLATATLLNLSSATPISAQNDNTGFTPTISGTALNLTNATGATITTSGLSADDLIISAPITSVGAITKAGNGSLVLPNANAANLTWNLAGGALILNNATALGANAGSSLNITGNGTLLAGTAALTIATPVIFQTGGNLALGGTSTLNQITLSGTVNLNGAAPAITVAAQPTTDTITGQITGTGGFTKAGAGALTLTPATASTFTGPVTVSGGLITMGNANAFGAAGNAGADYTVAAGSEINLNAFALSMGSLSGGGIVTDSGAAVALTVGAGSNGNNTTFSGSLAAATVANLSLVKIGTNNLTLSGQSYYTGVTTLTGGTITLKNSSASATTPTLANTAITVAAGQTLAISATGSPTTTVNIGNNVTTASGASLTLSPGSGSNAGANFTMADGLFDTFNIVQGATAGNGLTIGGTGTLTTNAPIMSFDIGAANQTSDLLAVTRAVSVGASGGVLAINVIGSNVNTGNSYTLITASSGLGDAKLTLANGGVINAGGHTYAANLTASTATSEILTIGALTSTLANAYWDGAQSANWNTYSSGSTNWSNAQATITEAGVLPAFNTNVFFTVNNPPGASNLSTTLGEDFTINSLNFLGTGTSATSPVSISGNNLTINAGTANGNAAGNGINVAAGSGAVTINSNVVLATSQTWTTNSSNSVTVNGVVSGGSANLNKAGTGTVVFTGHNTFTGTTSVSQGKVVVSGSLAGDVSVASGATLASGNNITSQVAAINAVSDALGGGTVAPGDTGGVADLSTIGQLNATSTVTLGTASTAGVAHLSMEIGGTNDGTTGGNTAGPLQYDRVAMAGSTLTLNNANLDVSAVNGYVYTGSTFNDNTQQLNLDSHIFFLITGASNVVGTFANQLAVGTDPNLPGFATIYGTDGQEFAVSYTANFAADTFTGGNDVAIMAIPEPNSLSMLAGSLGIALGLQRMRRRRKA